MRCLPLPLPPPLLLQCTRGRAFLRGRQRAQVEHSVALVGGEAARLALCQAGIEQRQCGAQVLVLGAQVQRMRAIHQATGAATAAATAPAAVVYRATTLAHAVNLTGPVAVAAGAVRDSFTALFFPPSLVVA